MPYIENKLITLNSHYGSQQNGSLLSNIVFSFTGILKKEDTIKHVYITVLNAQIPVSFYIINSTNHHLKVKDNVSNVTYLIPLSYGNYSGNSLIAEMLYQLQINGYPFLPAITLDKSSGKLTFVFPQSATILSSSTIRDILGIGTVNLTGTVITCPYPVNLLGVKLLNITSAALSVNSYSSVNGSNTNILATIPVDQPFFNMISYVNQNDIQKFELTTDYVNAIDIQILDEGGNYIDFNNTDWTITLGISIERVELQKQNIDLYKSLMSHNLQPEEHILTEDQSAIEPTEVEEVQEVQALDNILNPVSESTSEDGFLKQLIHGASSYTTKVKYILKEYGDQKITGITLKRTPITNAIYQTLNAISLGKFDSSNPYDNLFHLAMDITFENGRTIRLEKNATINMSTRPIDKTDTETFVVTGVPQISLNTLLENTKKRMGDKYFSYNAKGNNCQDYILNVFDANRIGDMKDREFIKQSVRDIFNKNPKYIKTITQHVTNLGGRFDLVKSEFEKHKRDLEFLLK